MRKAMICITMMLALVQFWPMMFGQKDVAEVASPGAQAAVVIAVPKRAAVVTVPVPAPVTASVSKGASPSNCFSQYKTKFATCAKGDAACGARINNQWDLCEATRLLAGITGRKGKDRNPATRRS